MEKTEFSSSSKYRIKNNIFEAIGVENIYAKEKNTAFSYIISFDYIKLYSHIKKGIPVLCIKNGELSWMVNFSYITTYITAGIKQEKKIILPEVQSEFIKICREQNITYLVSSNLNKREW